MSDGCAVSLVPSVHRRNTLLRQIIKRCDVVLGSYCVLATDGTADHL